MNNWAAKPVDELFTFISTRMPPGQPGSLSDGGYASVLAYILQSNGVAAGNRTLPADTGLLQAMVIPPPRGGANPSGQAVSPAAAGPGGGLTAGVNLPPAPPVVNPLEKITPVTDAKLIDPPAEDWLTWRRTYDDLGFSPLKQITKANVASLRVAWSWSLPNGPNEATPLVHDGVLFVHSYGDKVQAIDAATGDLLWQYSRALPNDAQPSVKRNIAIYQDKLYVATSDVHMVALDVKTGKVVWDKFIADYKSGVRMTGGPLVAKGKVMIGTVGRNPGGNFITALDTQTGRPGWKFNVIAQPGEPGGDSWNGLDLDKRNGASVWVAGSYDPNLNLVFFGPAQTYDTGPLLHAVDQPGVTNDALYTDSTVALNPDTGKLVWHFQHQPNDQWDLDWAFERQIIKMPLNGTLKPVVVTSGKQAIYDALDAQTGKYLFSMDLGLQNVVASIDPATGAKKLNPAAIPGKDPIIVCPHAGGAKSWLPGSYNPATKLLYVPLVESCMDLTPVAERPSLSSGVRWSLRPRLDSDGKYGRFEAIDLEKRKVVWTERQRAPRTTGALATAGGVVFGGSLDRVLKAYDDATGKVLWQTRLNDVPSNNPISYSVNGKQYIAVVVGNGGAQASTWPPLVPEIKNPPDHGAAIWVFELP
jgi:alcohol dehydrogenase (cytochrome c)